MDPSQYGAPVGWPWDMTLDDPHGTATVRKNLVGTAFDGHLQHRTSAGGYVPTPPSLGSRVIRQPQHTHNVPMPNWVNQERPPTPPLHHQENVPQYQDPWATSLSIRGSSDHILLPTTQANYTSSYGTYTPAHDHLAGRLDLQSAPSRQYAIQPPRLHPSANILRSSPEQQITRPEPTLIAPPVQQWPTHNLASHVPKVDAATRKKQEAYKRKGEALRKAGVVRRKTISSQDSAPQYAPVREPATTPRRRRKAKILDDLVMPTPALPLHPLYHSYGYQQQQEVTPGAVMNYHFTPQETLSHPQGTLSYPQEPQFYGTDLLGHGQYHTSIPSSYHPHYGGAFDAQPALYPRQHPPHTPAPLPLPPSPPNIIDPETIPQLITDNYDEYMWPVKLYQLQAGKGHDCAECFLQTHFQQNIYDSVKHKWTAHTTKGFIKDGNRFSILVLHNAANPFQWGTPPESTTSIGVYGLYAHRHDEIRWTTIAPSISKWMQSCIDQGLLAIKQEWHPDMKASEKRFHRAYWLAAKMLPLNRMLNHSRAPEKPHGLLEDGEDEEGDGFVITEEDLQHEWIGETVSVEKSEKTWQKLIDQVDALDLGSGDSEHVAIGGSERAFDVD
ncbi:hypothetical protein ACET3X_002665 [Alternaria dauci]|uniref:Uncharacterized protein n=1 Tax=Alternaria dauci TaxID=48095 RepID=A0ABR3URD7_9PLEO